MSVVCSFKVNSNHSRQALDKGRFSRTDHYVDHAMTETKATLLVTDRRVVLMSLDLFGQWQVR